MLYKKYLRSTVGPCHCHKQVYDGDIWKSSRMVCAVWRERKWGRESCEEQLMWVACDATWGHGDVPVSAAAKVYTWVTDPAAVAVCVHVHVLWNPQRPCRCPWLGLPSVALSEDLGLVPSTHMVAHNHPELQFQDMSPCASLTPVGSRQTRVHIHRCRQKHLHT